MTKRLQPPSARKPTTSIPTRLLLPLLLFFCVFVLFVCVTTVERQPFSATKQPNSSATNSSSYYAPIFRHLISQRFLSTNSKSLCIVKSGDEVVSALKEVGVLNSVAISTKKSLNLPFKNRTFDFEFSSVDGLDRTLKPVQFASEVSRTLKPGGFFALHTQSTNDNYNYNYSFNSLLQLFEDFALINSRPIAGLDSLPIREIVLRKLNKSLNSYKKTGDGCSVSKLKHELIGNAEPLIEIEPLKPWITLKQNIKNMKYLSAMADISFKNRYVYIDVGARNYGSSIGGWFKKQYPKQGKSFEIYAIEADRAFHDEYKTKKGVTLLPYAAWIRNESLFFEIGREPVRKDGERRGRGMGRVHSSSSYLGDMEIRGFDFAVWLKGTFVERDYVVVKMDVEGIEFQLISRLVETGAICLIDEMFVECHYNRWQSSFPGKRSPKYQKTYAQCLELFSSLRKSGVLVHQWF